MKFRGGPAHDFGVLLASGQTLTHDFELVNPTDKPISLTSAVSWTPCCSKVLPVAGPIPAHGTGKLTVEFRPGFQAGARRLSFEIHTDEAGEPHLGFGVTAELTAALDVRRLPDSDLALPLNRPGRQRFEVVCRQVGDAGRGPLQGIEVQLPLAAAFAGPATATTPTPGTRESTRTIDVALPALSEVGPHRGDLTLIWGDGSREAQIVDWKVDPLVSLSPTGLTLGSVEGRSVKAVTVRAADRPIRILGAAGPILAAPFNPPAAAARTHVLRLDLDAAKVDLPATSEIVLTTDHPDQPKLIISILRLPSSQAGGQP